MDPLPISIPHPCPFSLLTPAPLLPVVAAAASLRCTCLLLASPAAACLLFPALLPPQQKRIEARQNQRNKDKQQRQTRLNKARRPNSKGEARIESLAQERGWCAGHEAQPGTHTMCVFGVGGEEGSSCITMQSPLGTNRRVGGGGYRRRRRERTREKKGERSREIKTLERRDGV